MSETALMGFTVVAGELQVGGMPLSRLARRVGSTPFYAYDRRLLGDRVASLRAALPAGIALQFSIKANPMPALVQHMAPLVDGFDVASVGEMKIALDAGMRAGDITFAGPGKTDAAIAQAVAAGVNVSVESEREIRLLASLSEAFGVAANVIVRVNPDFELRSSGMRMGGGARQFGIDAEEAPLMLSIAAILGVDVQGFHVFCGSQCLNSDAIGQAQTRTVDLAIRLSASARAPVRKLHIGGGFGIPYFPGERALDISVIGAHLAGLQRIVAAALPQARMSVELGRYLAGEAGIYVTRVIERKVSRGKVFLVTDGGMHHHLAASGNLGQVIRKNFPVIVGNRMDAPKAGMASVVGPLCTPLDLLADQMELGHAQAGDLIVVLQSGAYGLTASPSAFLGHPIALEVLV